MPEGHGPLRILHVSALNLWAMKGNAGMCCLYETLRGHVRAGHSVSIVIPAYDLWDDGRTPLPPPPSDEFDVHFARCRWLPAVKSLRSFCARLGRGPETPYLLRWCLGWITWTLLTWSLFWAAARLVRRTKGRFDMVYAHCEYAAIAGFLVRLAFRIPNVTRLYGTFVASLMNKPLVQLRYPIAAGGFLVPHSLLICANDGTRGDEVARHFRLDMGRVCFWQDGVDKVSPPSGAGREDVLKHAPANLRSTSKWILSCSRLDYWKRIDRILRAVSVCQRSGADCQLLVAGEGATGPALRALAAELGIAEQVVWLGAVPHDKIWQLMYLADAFVITNDVTNRCNPVFEAIRTRLPVVSIEDQSTADLLIHGENALLAARDDDQALGQCLFRVCQDAELAQGMRRAQRHRDEKLWTWEERMDVENRVLAELARAWRCPAPVQGSALLSTPPVGEGGPR
jgi:glycosyltransferase involved in cell wall biosynthesis